MRLRFILACGAFLYPGLAWALDSTYSTGDVPDLNDPVQGEPVVIASPQAAVAVPLPGFSNMTALAVSHTSSVAAMIVADGSGTQSLVLWDPRKPTLTIRALPGNVRINSLAWHPVTQSLFAAGTIGGKPGVFGFDPAAPDWGLKPLWQGPLPVDELLMGPRPFTVGAHRLFFTEHEPNGETWVRAITDVPITQTYRHFKQNAETVFTYVTDSSPYIVSGKSAPPLSPPQDYGPPEPLKAEYSHLIGFHPDGARMYLEDARGCVDTLNYAMAWHDLAAAPVPCHDSNFEISPNGLLALDWHPGSDGVTAVDLVDGSQTPEGVSFRFTAEPRVTADGRGLIGITGPSGQWVLHYLPIALKLADVANAWNFLSGSDPATYAAKKKRLIGDGGFLTDSGQDQIYKFYDTEVTECGGDSEIPLRPYMITTDAMWEVYAAAYDGLFGLVERQKAIPAFTEMVNLGKTEFAAKAPGSRLAKMFAAAAELIANDSSDPEAARILSHQNGPGQVLPLIDYATLAPRGFYTDTPELGRYFAAFHYLTSLHLQAEDFAVLRGVSPEFRKAALDWQQAYGAFIAASRGGDAIAMAQVPGAVPGDFAYLFPLSFGADNDILYNTVDDRVYKRPVGSGLDVAAVLHSATAWLALQDSGEFARYPELEPALVALKARLSGSLGSDPIYDHWLESLRPQWGPAPQTPISGKLWDAKRLQTGLASWATLRHATVLVNEETGAECGGPSPEEVIPRPPRGYVEPDPATFEAIANMFGATAVVVRKLFGADDPVGTGIIERLNQSRDDALDDAAVAGEEIAGQPLNAEQYAEIANAGQSIEYNFKVFLSLGSDGNGIAIPDPIQKIADVSGETETGWVEAAVGNVMEWDQIIPDFGHHDIVKGGTYSYFEFKTSEPLDDDAWRQRVNDTPNPVWIAPFILK